MLERTAGCLETGSIRRLLPASNHTVKSRRSLHSAFWNHAAGDSEVPSLWAALVQGQDARQEGLAAEQTKSRGNGGLLLEFLYPAGTMKLLRKYSTWALERQNEHLGKPGFSSSCQRLYTSSTTPDNLSVDRDNEALLPAKGTDSVSQSGAESSLYEKLGLLRDNDYDEAWRQYRVQTEEEKKALRHELMRYYSTSSRIVDAERTIDLFNHTAEGNDTDMFQHAIRAYLFVAECS